MQLNIFGIEELFNEKHIIDNSDALERSNAKKGSFTTDGIYSEEIFGKLNNSSHYDYSCLCGETKGKFYQHLKCPSCGHSVKQQSSLVRRLGWIDLGDFRVIHPYFYHQIERIIGPAELKRILTYTSPLDINGHETIGDESNPLHSLGVTAFHEQLFEVLEQFVSPKNENILEVLKAKKDIIFTSKIPVISSKLRPALVKGNEISYDRVNNSYTRIITTSNYLNTLTVEERTKLIANPLLVTLQELYNTVDDHYLSALGGKGGWFRNSFLANYLNFSSRCVIIPLQAKYAMDEVHIPYWVGLKLFKFHIVNELSKKYKYNFAQANKRHKEAYKHIDEEIAGIMDALIKKSYYTTSDNKTRYGYHTLINRNPTIL